MSVYARACAQLIGKVFAQSRDYKRVAAFPYRPKNVNGFLSESLRNLD